MQWWCRDGVTAFSLRRSEPIEGAKWGRRRLRRRSCRIARSTQEINEHSAPISGRLGKSEALSLTPARSAAPRPAAILRQTSIAIPGEERAYQAQYQVCELKGRIRADEWNIDWAETWGYDHDGLFHLDYTLVETGPNRPFTFLTEILITCNKEATLKYRMYEQAGLDWIGRLIIAEVLTELAPKEKLDLLIRDQRPVGMNIRMQDKSSPKSYDLRIRTRRLGEDNGKDQLIHITNYLRHIRDYVRQRVRKPTDEEAARMRKPTGGEVKTRVVKRVRADQQQH